VKLLVDTDPGADDAVAILLALRTPGAEVVALTTVAGNVDVEQATHNALKTLSVAGRLDVPVHPGAAVSLVTREPERAESVHGRDGFGDHDFAPVGAAQRDGAVDATLALLREHAGLTYVALGPLTNLAHTIRADHETCRRVGHVVVMGGTGDGIGNVTPAAEYNFWCDPEAARIVLRSGLPVRLVGWDVSRRDAVVTAADVDRLRASGDPIARFAADVTRRYYEFVSSAHMPGAMDLPDPVAMAAALEPDRATWQRVAADVECTGELTRGALVIDHWGTTGAEPNVDLCTGFDHDHFVRTLVERLTTPP
jgi:purine nucleosidase